jgi:hypothetical protein
MLARDDVEHAVPSVLHDVLSKVADAFAAGDFLLQVHAIEGVRPIDLATAEWVAKSIAAYGDSLAPLHPSTWNRSIYRWMDGYWQLLVDLSTTREQVSDLTLHAKLYDTEPLTLEIESVHVA